MKIIVSDEDPWSSQYAGTDLGYELATWPPLITLLESLETRVDEDFPEQIQKVLDELIAHVKDVYNLDIESEVGLLSDRSISGLYLDEVDSPWRIVYDYDAEEEHLEILDGLRKYYPCVDEQGNLSTLKVSPQDLRRLGLVL